MDDPTPRSKNTPGIGCVFGGSCSQARAPITFFSYYTNPYPAYHRCSILCLSVGKSFLPDLSLAPELMIETPA